MGGSGGDAGEVFKKFVKKQWKIYNFLKNVQENFAIFSKYFKILSHFWQKFGQKLRKLGNLQLYGILGAEPLDASEVIEIWVEK